MDTTVCRIGLPTELESVEKFMARAANSRPDLLICTIAFPKHTRISSFLSVETTLVYAVIANCIYSHAPCQFIASDTLPNNTIFCGHLP